MKSTDLKKIKEAMAGPAGQAVSSRPATGAISPVELEQKKKNIQLAANNPNAKLSVPTNSGTSEVRDFEGIIDDPDDPNSSQIAVLGDREGELEVLNIEDVDLLEDIMKLSGVKK